MIDLYFSDGSSIIVLKETIPDYISEHPNTYFCKYNSNLIDSSYSGYFFILEFSWSDQQFLWCFLNIFFIEYLLEGCSEYF